MLLLGNESRKDEGAQHPYTSYSLANGMASTFTEYLGIQDFNAIDSGSSDLSSSSEGSSRISPKSVLWGICVSASFRREGLSTKYVKMGRSKSSLSGDKTSVARNIEGIMSMPLENRRHFRKADLESVFGNLDMLNSLKESHASIMGMTEEEERELLQGTPLSVQRREDTNKMHGESTSELFSLQGGSSCSDEITPETVPRQEPLPQQTAPHKIQSGKKFTYNELQTATKNFSEGAQAGTGGCSTVYKGNVPEDGLVAIKFLPSNVEGEKEFLMEIATVARIQHKNLVQYLGYCVEGVDHLLVYKFIPNGNLQQYLEGGSKSSLTWKQRYRVALGAAKGLECLHFSLPQQIIHRDVKSSNILLDEEFEAQISDFGLAKLSSIDAAETHCSGLVGTFGYMAPEYLLYGTVNAKTDVYSFGVVLLELISGRVAIDSTRQANEKSLVQWVKLKSQLEPK